MLQPMPSRAAECKRHDCAHQHNTSCGKKVQEHGKAVLPTRQQAGDPFESRLRRQHVASAAAALAPQPAQRQRQRLPAVPFVQRRSVLMRGMPAVPTLQDMRVPYMSLCRGWVRAGWRLVHGGLLHLRCLQQLLSSRRKLLHGRQRRRPLVLPGLRHGQAAREEAAHGVCAQLPAGPLASRGCARAAQAVLARRERGGCAARRRRARRLPSGAPCSQRPCGNVLQQRIEVRVCRKAGKRTPAVAAAIA